MKILQVIDQIGLKYGGSATIPRKLSRELAKLGHEVIVYSSDAGVADGVPDVVNLRAFKTYLTLAGSIRITPSMLFAKFGRFDLIHCHNYYTFQNFVARFRNYGVPMVLQPHGTFVLYDGIFRKVRPTFYIIDYPWRLWFLKRMDLVICNSSLEVEQSTRLGVKKLALVPNGIDISEFAGVP